MLTSAPLGYFFGSEGPAANETLTLDWVFTGIVLLVCVLVTMALAAAIWRKRDVANARDLAHTGSGLRMVFALTALSTGRTAGDDYLRADRAERRGPPAASSEADHHCDGL